MTDPALDPRNWETIEPYVADLLATPLDAASVRPWLERWSHLTAHFHECMGQIYRAVDENTADESARADFNWMVEELFPRVERLEQALKRRLLAVEGYTPAPDEQFLVRQFRSEAEIYADANIPLLTEMRKKANRYEQAVGEMTVEWEGETLTLPQAERHLESRDRTVRERVWHRLMERRLAARDEFNQLFVDLHGLRQQVAANAGLPDFRAYQWKALGRYDYTPEDCFLFHEGIEQEVVPLARELRARRRQRLGVDRLRPWDLDVDPDGPPLEPFHSADELEETGSRIFHQIDPVLGGHFDAMRPGMLDLESRPNKAPGGYCNTFPLSRSAYIFMNAVGTQDDVSTLLHEGGHAFHYFESRHLPLIWQEHVPMEFAEVASIAMELLGAPYLAREQGGFYAPEDARRAYRQLLEKTVTFLPYMAVVDAFQHRVYQLPAGTLEAADLDQIWDELWSRFMVGTDWEGLEAARVTGWQRKVHLFSSPFYYVEYGLAYIGALQIWANALLEPQRALARYRGALALGATRPLPALFAAAGATFSFDRTTIGRLMALLRQEYGDGLMPDR